MVLTVKGIDIIIDFPLGRIDEKDLTCLFSIFCDCYFIMPASSVITRLKNGAINDLKNYGKFKHAIKNKKGEEGFFSIEFYDEKLRIYGYIPWLNDDSRIQEKFENMVRGYFDEKGK